MSSLIENNRTALLYTLTLINCMILIGSEWFHRSLTGGLTTVCPFEIGYTIQMFGYIYRKKRNDGIGHCTNASNDLPDKNLEWIMMEGESSDIVIIVQMLFVEADIANHSANLNDIIHSICMIFVEYVICSPFSWAQWSRQSECVIVQIHFSTCVSKWMHQCTNSPTLILTGLYKHWTQV